MPTFFGWEGSLTKIDYRKKGTLILTSLLQDLVVSPLLLCHGGAQPRCMPGGTGSGLSENQAALKGT